MKGKISLEKAMDLLSLEDDLYFSAKEKEGLISTSSIAKKVEKLAPDVEILPPRREKEEREKVTESIIVLCHNEKDRTFLRNLTQALINRFGNVLFLSLEESKKKDLSSAQTIIAFTSLKEEKACKNRLAEIPQKKRYSFDQKPLILLPDFFYRNDPLQKQKVWQHLCQTIPNMLTSS